ncbi:type II toxin-antitoxin system VapC family toxin [Aminobacter sp. BE322]|uniref:type II toxin-antitoxin system VapC family toxin n=1 Tax=unclassified Aminobacter TaxID=2644704 RepID=UPI003D20389D
MIVLDTNVISEADKPRPNTELMQWFDRQPGQDLYLCGPVVMELAYGAEKHLVRTGSDKYLTILGGLEEQFRGRILEFDGRAPALTGRIRAQREGLGRVISVQDAMIAAICIVHGARLATRNVRDFDGLDLGLVNPFEAMA